MKKWWWEKNGFFLRLVLGSDSRRLVSLCIRHANPRILVSCPPLLISCLYIIYWRNLRLDSQVFIFCFFVFCFVLLFKNNFKNKNTQRNCEMSPSGVCPKSWLPDLSGLNFFFSFFEKWFLENFITALLILKWNGIYPEIFLYNFHVLEQICPLNFFSDKGKG